MKGRYVITELLRRSGRTWTAILSVMVGVALFISLQAYADGFYYAARTPLTEIGADIVIQREGEVPESFEGIVLPHSTAPLSEKEIEIIRKTPGVEEVGKAAFFWSFQKEKFLVGLGIDPNNKIGPGKLRVAMREGRFLQANDQNVVIMDTSYATQNNVKVGEKITVMDQAFEVVGLVDTSRVGSVANANIYMTLSEANKLLQNAANVRSIYKLESEVSNIVFVKADSSRSSAIVEELKQKLPEKTLVTTPRSFEEVLGTTFDIIDRFGLLVGAAGLLIALASQIRTISAGLWERRRDIGLMRAVGWRRKEVIWQLTMETVTVTTIGWGLGVIAAAVIAWGLGFSEVTVPVPWELSPTPHFLPGGEKEMSITVPMNAQVSFQSAGISFLLSLVGALIISLWLTRKVTNIKPAEVLRSE